MSPTRWFRLLGLSAFLIALTFAVPALTEDAKPGKKYALLVGVKSYEHSKLGDLKYTENDAEALAAVLKEAKYEVVVLTTSRGAKDGKARPTKANIDRELAALLKKVTKHDVVLIGLSGHGVQYEVKGDNNKKRDESFFCPADARIINSDDFDRLSATMISFRKLFDQLDDSGAGSRLLLIDACRNDPGSSRNADTNAMPNPTKGTAALFACKGGERAWESDKLGGGHGVFFYHVIEALKGKAKNRRGAVTWDSLTRHVREEVGEEVERLIGGSARQTPHLMANVEGDPVLIQVGKSVVEKPRENDKAGKEAVVKGKDTFTNSLGMTLVRVKAGRFKMGSPKGEADRGTDEDQHEVEITKDFFIGVTEVTQGQWKAIMGYNPSHFSQDGKKAEGGKYKSDPAGGKDKVKDFALRELDNFPVENVSWEAAQEFFKRLNARAAEATAKVKYRLPTEAEWEYSCRGGHLIKDLKERAELPFHFKTPSASLGAGQANFDARNPYGGGKKGDWLGRTNAVSKNGEPNALGLYDMHGNTEEWCSDWYGTAYDRTNAAKKDPTGPATGSMRVFRGGSRLDDGRNCRAAKRGLLAPDERYSYLGFRVVAVQLE